jgi:hypothetical protein
MIVLHDDAKREYAYGPEKGLPNTRVGTFTQALYEEAKKEGWIVISMKDDWKRIFCVRTMTIIVVSKCEHIGSSRPQHLQRQAACTSGVDVLARTRDQRRPK